MTPKILAASAVLALLAGFSPARAESGALIILADREDALERAEHIQSLLLDRHHFDNVRIEMDKRPDEAASAVADFLEEPGKDGDRRLVWVSGPSEGVCSFGDKRTKPETAALVLGPECLADLIEYPDEPVIYDINATGIDPQTGADPYVVEMSPENIAFLALPGDDDGAAAEADSLIVSVLELQRNNQVSPAYVLEVLRRGLAVDGSDFSPILYASNEDSALATNLVSGEGDAGDASGLAAWNPPAPRGAVMPNRLELDFFSSPNVADGPVAQLHGGYMVQPLRKDRSGKMMFVRTFTGHYGWVMAEDLGAE